MCKEWRRAWRSFKNNLFNFTLFLLLSSLFTLPLCEHNTAADISFLHIRDDFRYVSNGEETEKKHAWSEKKLGTSSIVTRAAKCNHFNRSNWALFDGEERRKSIWRRKMKLVEVVSSAITESKHSIKVSLKDVEASRWVCGYNAVWLTTKYLDNSIWPEVNEGSDVVTTD